MLVLYVLLDVIFMSKGKKLCSFVMLCILTGESVCQVAVRYKELVKREQACRVQLCLHLLLRDLWNASYRRPAQALAAREQLASEVCQAQESRSCV